MLFKVLKNATQQHILITLPMTDLLLIILHLMQKANLLAKPREGLRNHCNDAESIEKSK